MLAEIQPEDSSTDQTLAEESRSGVIPLGTDSTSQSDGGGFGRGLMWWWTEV